MYSKEEIIAQFAQEVHLLSHLASKIPADKYDWKPNDSTRTFSELLQYMSRMATAPISILTGGYVPETMKQLRLDTEARDVATEFTTMLEEQLAVITAYILETSDEELEEEIDFFGNMMRRKDIFLGMVFKNFPAYRMQIFMYLKIGLGMENLQTANLWMGKDAA